MAMKALIIEDDHEIAEIYGHKFKEEGFEVEKAENGAWGLKKIQEKKFDIVILDMSMPAMDGLEMLLKIKEEKEKNGYPKVFVLSNTALEDDLKAMQQAGADKVFIKIRVTPKEVFNEAINIIKSQNEI